MTTPPAGIDHSPGARTASANERFKASSRRWFWASLGIAALLHVVAFVLSPGVSVVVESVLRPELDIVPMPSDVGPAPSRFVAFDRRALRVAPLDDQPAERLSPIPPPERPLLSPPPQQELAQEPALTPYSVAPELKNREEVRERLAEAFPIIMREAGGSASLHVWFFIDARGAVRNTQVHTSSGYPAVDSVALRVAEIMEFTPAWNHDERVPVWVALPITFQPDSPTPPDTAAMHP